MLQSSSPDSVTIFMTSRGQLFYSRNHQNIGTQTFKSCLRLSTMHVRRQRTAAMLGLTIACLERGRHKELGMLALDPGTQPLAGGHGSIPVQQGIELRVHLVLCANVGQHSARVVAREMHPLPRVACLAEHGRMHARICWHHLLMAQSFLGQSAYSIS